MSDTERMKFSNHDDIGYEKHPTIMQTEDVDKINAREIFHVVWWWTPNLNICRDYLPIAERSE